MSIVLLALISTSTNSITIDELIDSFNYNYTNGSINVISKTDSILDQNNNGIPDTLAIQLTNQVLQDNTYNFIISLSDKDNIFTNSTSKLITSQDNQVQINFPTELFESNKFNYTLEITNQNNELVYREYKTQTNFYPNYEKGIVITKIMDENLYNNFVRINLTVNSTINSTKNITVTLSTNSSTISKTEEKSLNSGLQTISINFDNETIKSTHNNGKFLITNAVIGNKNFKLNKNTSIYNYENFAKTSYIKSILHSIMDTNSNDLSEELKIDFTLNIKSTGIYNITYDLYDEFENYIATINKQQTFSSQGIQIMQTSINGTQIYKTKINGPYLVSFAKLSSTQSSDIVFNAYTTNQTFYTDFERPQLPDLKLDLSSTLNLATKINNIEVNLSNIGTASAFNVFLDVFDNSTYNNNRSLSFMDVGQKINFKFNITNSSNSTLITGIADFENLVDEIDEANNIDQNKKQTAQSNITNTAPIISTIPNINFNEDSFDAILDLDNYVNDLEDADSLLSWKSSGNSNIFVSINPITHLVNFTAQPNFFGSENIKFTVNDTGGLTANDTILVTVNSINDAPLINTFAPSSLNPSVTIGQNIVFNHTSSDFDSGSLFYSWKLDGTLKSFSQGWNYAPLNGEAGNHIISLNVSDSSLSSIIQWNVLVLNQTNQSSLANIDVNGFSLIYDNANLKTFEFIINNSGNSTLSNINWTLNTGLGILSSASPLIIPTAKNVFVFAAYDYTQGGSFIANATAKNSNGQDSQLLSVNVPIIQNGINVYNLNVLNASGTRRLFEFNINNSLNSTLTNLSWIFDTKNDNVINGLNTNNLQSNKQLFVFVDYNFAIPPGSTANNPFNVNATAQNSTLKDSINLTILV